MSSEKDLSIIVVSYNTARLTCEAVRSALDETRNLDFEMIVFDNASTDSSVADLEEALGERITLIKSPENLGFAKANNVAAEGARGRYLLLLNPDTVVLDGAVEKLVAFAGERPEAKIWGGRTLFEDGALNPASCWNRTTLWSLTSQCLGLSSVFRASTLFNPEGIGGWDRTGTRRVDIVTGCFFLIEKAFWDELGGFDPAFFMYGEEADLCLRAARKGARPMITSRAEIIHYGGASETVRADKMVRLLSASMLLIRRHFPPHTAWLATTLFGIWPLSRALGHRAFSALGRAASAERARTWHEIWKRRTEWWIA